VVDSPRQCFEHVDRSDSRSASTSNIGRLFRGDQLQRNFADFLLGTALGGVASAEQEFFASDSFPAETVRGVMSVPHAGHIHVIASESTVVSHVVKKRDGRPPLLINALLINALDTPLTRA
jgi:hypothetical protein